ncbi:hypothetical protein DL766_000335 [Monosporascus sp. MC13-8B]|uniref:Uncharacterized protein n=1 Tax=Monosporascus cannonballus TaxID=155416 RepID=A0ABY0HGX1_9PEZI|nr:hypothetical protein DL762_001647 [Monosporascus cannonballus]RYP00005.1 hypothetical protein DL763_001135 [Monosporascus cannonballus]RYP39513.1 hypothetical protein DL766_000335 [Monosporascus sp. MC13-8B]
MWSFQALFLAAVSRGATTNVPDPEPDISVVLESRQMSEDARECHADCGYFIVDSSLPDQCGNSTWTDLLDDCLDCALEYDIWSVYGDGVTQAAGACDLPAVPEQPDADESVSPSMTLTSPPNATGTVSTAVSTTTVSTTSSVDGVSSTTGEGASPTPTDSLTPEGRAVSIKTEGYYVVFFCIVAIVFNMVT